MAQNASIRIDEQLALGKSDARPRPGCKSGPRAKGMVTTESRSRSGPEDLYEIKQNTIGGFAKTQSSKLNHHQEIRIVLLEGILKPTVVVDGGRIIQAMMIVYPSDKVKARKPLLLQIKQSGY